VESSCQPSDVELLRHTFPSWSIAAVWQAVPSGPDSRLLVAIRGEVTLTAWNADDLAAQVTATQINAALKGDQ
jgi:hypothetical protein